MYEEKPSLLITLSIAALCFACVAAIAPLAAAGSASATEDTDETYVITQGDQEFEVEPVGDGEQTAEEFYDYRTPETHDPPDFLYSSYGTTEYQEDDTSILMLHEGSDGLSLVMVHDQVDGETRGGSLTMQLNGLPEEGEWVVEDDYYSDDHHGGPLDEFDHDETSSRITWVWSEGRTDGGAFNGGLDNGDFEIEIDPYFNESADFRYEDPEGYDGDIDDWQVISGVGDDDFERISLDSLDEPITIEPGGLPELSVSSVSAVPSSVGPKETAEIRSAVSNTGNADGTFDIDVTVDGEVTDTKEVSLDEGETEQITAESTFEEPGSYELGIEDTTTSVQVIDEPTNGSENGENETDGDTDDSGGEEQTNSSTETQQSDDSLPGFDLLGAAVGVGAAVFLLSQRYRRGV